MRRSNAVCKIIAAKHAAAATSAALVAAPGAGMFLRIFRVIATVRIAAAQIMDVGVSAGTDAQQLFSIPASGTAPVFWESDSGFDLPANTALSSVVPVAGPEVRFNIEYQIVNS